MSAFSAELERLRSAHGYSYAALARRAHYSKPYVYELAQGRKPPTREAANRLDAALDAGGALAALAGRPPADLPLWTPGMTPEPGRPLDDTDVTVLRATLSGLIQMDTAMGGASVLDPAVRAFRTASERLAVHGTRGGAADMQAAVADLGICASWVAADSADRQMARTLGLEALALAEFSGETRLRRFLISQLSMIAEHAGRGAEALAWAERALADDPADPRVRAMFLMRRARALGKLGATSDALAAWDQAEQLLAVGPDGGDGLTYWLHDSEMAVHRAVILADGGQHADAVDWGQRSLSLLPAAQGRDQVLFRAMLVADAAHAGAWPEVEAAAREILAYGAAARSGRVPESLRAALAVARTRRAPAGAIEAVTAALAIST